MGEGVCGQGGQLLTPTTPLLPRTEWRRRLEDFNNACGAYEKALSMQNDHLFRLNYAVTLHSAAVSSSPEDDRPPHGVLLTRSKEQFAAFQKLWDVLDEEAKRSDPDVARQRKLLMAALREAE